MNNTAPTIGPAFSLQGLPYGCFFDLQEDASRRRRLRTGRRKIGVRTNSSPNFLLLILVLIRENQIDLLISEQIDERFRERLIVRARDAYAALVVRGQNRRDYPQNARILKKPADSEHGNRCRFVDAAAGIVPSLAYGKRLLAGGRARPG